MMVQPYPESKDDWPDRLPRFGHCKVFPRPRRIEFINCRIWKGNDLAVANLSHCVRHVITPPRKVDEDAPVLRDGHAGGHRCVEFEHRLDMANGAIGGKLSGRWRRSRTRA